MRINMPDGVNEAVKLARNVRVLIAKCLPNVPEQRVPYSRIRAQETDAYSSAMEAAKSAFYRVVDRIGETYPVIDKALDTKGMRSADAVRTEILGAAGLSTKLTCSPQEKRLVNMLLNGDFSLKVEQALRTRIKVEPKPSTNMKLGLGSTPVEAPDYQKGYPMPGGWFTGDWEKVDRRWPDGLSEEE
jgi:hypothetical protein